MFTGIIQEVGKVQARDESGAGARIEISANGVTKDAEVGGSIAVNGACLTVTECRPDGFVADVMAETLRHTNLGDLAIGSLVNLERSARIQDRLDGHIVQGHIDAVGEIRSIEPAKDSTLIRIDAPADVLRYCVFKGSVAIDGISFTIASLDAHGLKVSVIPHTWQVTALRDRPVGSKVNLEPDILGKYLAQYVERYVENLMPKGPS